MKKYILAWLSLSAAIFIVGCGGGAQTPEDQVREVSIKSIEAALSDHPANLCNYNADPGKCRQGIVMAEALGMDLSEMMKTALPKDWKDQVKTAKVTINGNTASMASIAKDEKPDTYVKQNGKWLSADS